ncbi:unnamed protein product [Caenorhabditis auriculariae]|uniref:non-specific serine/threonine protein kinase n=1 Tax=Caenorhabditis auriculariae TaxID=2777116 RepID=A0A8S1HAV9_9PELO|nr:unnamed protein product [Caenorhabditis auriculariae]
MVEGEPPYFNDQPFQAMKLIRDQPAPTFSRHANVSEELSDMLSRCVVKDVTRRWSAADLLRHPMTSRAQQPAILAPLILRNQANP